MKSIVTNRRVQGAIAVVLASAFTAGMLVFSAPASAQTATPPTSATPQARTVQPGQAGRRGGPGGPMRGVGPAGMAAVATALGLDETTLRDRLQSGKSIADLAKEKSVDLTALSASLLDAQKTELAKQVADGTITQAEADKRLADAPARINDFLNGVAPAGRGPGQDGRHGGPAGGQQDFAVIAKALGTDEATLRTELQSGKTIADLAKAKGVDLTALWTTLLDAEKARLAQSVKDGTITQAEADQHLADAPAHITDMLNGIAPAGRGPGQDGRHGGQKGGPNGGKQGFAVVAKALGLDESALKTELQSGKTIAELAKAKSIDLAAIASDMLTAQKADLAQAVTDGKLTQAQADQMLADAPQRIDDFLNGKMPARPQWTNPSRSNKAPVNSPLPTPSPSA